MRTRRPAQPPPSPRRRVGFYRRVTLVEALCGGVMTVLLAVVLVRNAPPALGAVPTGGGVPVAPAARAQVRPCHEQEGTRTRGGLASPMYLEACVSGWTERGSGR